MRTTLKDVANQAGVSIRAVSRVINNKGEVSAETHQRIADAIQQLDYRPNQLARSLITGKTLSIGIIIPDITDPFFPELILGAESIARERGYNIFLCNANRQPELELIYIDLLSQRQVDGFIIAGSRLDQANLITATQHHHAVILAPYALPGKIIFTIDDFDGGRQIGEYLIDLGHKRVAYVEGTWSRGYQGRYAGLTSAFEGKGIANAVVMTSVFPARIDSACQATRELLKREPQITALVGYNDIVALGILQACRELGKNVPEEISVVGFDDIPEASRTIPELTSVHIDRLDLGGKMMQFLLDEIAGKSLSSERVVIKGQLIKRASSAQVPLAK
ncbi:MAG: LacI family DNA-binding transcriptional regulator [Anaerolineaceae bacterium]|nr:LacI family DNA-binding transcriptional regulator [Anaerolineaceae bacterium]